jgi:cytochrome P450
VGSETTGTAATDVIFQLVNNPQKVKLLLEELDAAFPSLNDPIAFAKTQDLPYLNAVMLEGMRLMVIPGCKSNSSISIIKCCLDVY